MNSYVVVIEPGKRPNSFGAHIPDLPGCVAVGESEAEVIDLIRGAVRLHILGMIEDGLEVPEPASTTRQIKIGRVPILEPLQRAAKSHGSVSPRKKSSSAPHAKSTMITMTMITMTKGGRKKAAVKTVHKKTTR